MLGVLRLKEVGGATVSPVRMPAGVDAGGADCKFAVRPGAAVERIPDASKYQRTVGDGDQRVPPAAGRGHQQVRMCRCAEANQLVPSLMCILIGPQRRVQDLVLDLVRHNNQAGGDSGGGGGGRGGGEQKLDFLHPLRSSSSSWSIKQ